MMFFGQTFINLQGTVDSLVYGLLIYSFNKSEVDDGTIHLTTPLVGDEAT